MGDLLHIHTHTHAHCSLDYGHDVQLQLELTDKSTEWMSKAVTLCFTTQTLHKVEVTKT